MKKIKKVLSACALLVAAVSIGSARAADAAFEADSARLAALLAEPQKGDRLLWMRKGPFVAESGKLSEHRNLAKSLLARIDKEREGADVARKEVLRRRASPPPHPLVRQLRPAEIVAKPINPLDTKWVYGL